MTNLFLTSYRKTELQFVIKSLFVLVIIALPIKSASEGEPMQSEIDKIITLFLGANYDDGEYDVVHPTTAKLSDYYDERHQSKDDYKKLLIKELKIDDPGFGRLIDHFIEINITQKRLTIASEPENGFIVDYDGEFSSYFKDNGGGWEKWKKEHPKAKNYKTISLPAYDPKSKIVLIYDETMFGLFGSGEGSGWITAFKYEEGKLVKIGNFLEWQT